jgi:hypothetical protein
MLETLDSINWKEVRGFRDTSDIPRLIRDLTSLHPLVRREAIGNLYEDLWHQETVCEATTCTVPFLIELLAEPAVEDKLNIIRFLSTIIIDFYDLFQYRCSAAVLSQHRSNESQRLERWRDRDLDRVKSEVCKGYLVYQQLLSTKEPPLLRGAIAYLLGILMDCNDQNLNLLKLHFFIEPDEGIRGIIVLAVGLLADDRHEQAAWLKNIFDTGDSLFLKINAAIGLTRVIPDRIPDKIVNILVNAIANPGREATLFDRYFWCFDVFQDEYIVQDYCRVTLNNIVNRSPQLLTILIDTLEVGSLISSCWIANCILDSIFNCQKISRDLTIDRLSTEQKMGLEAISNSKQFWSDYSNSHKYNYRLLESFGLPTDREQLRAFMAGELSLADYREDSVPF